MESSSQPIATTLALSLNLRYLGKFLQISNHKYKSAPSGQDLGSYVSSRGSGSGVEVTKVRYVPGSSRG